MSLYKTSSIQVGGMSSRPVQIKILVMGDRSVGKSTAIEHFKSKTFQPSYFPTEEPVMTPFQLKISNEPVAVNLWELSTDTPVTSTRVFEKIDGVILAFDAANASTFNNLEKCLQRLFEVDNYFKDNIPFTICQLKIDRDPQQVKFYVAERWCKSRGPDFEIFECSSKNGIGVGDAFSNNILRAKLRKEKKIPKSSVSPSSSGGQHDLLFQIQQIDKKMSTGFLRIENIDKKMSTGFLRIENRLKNLEKRVSKLERTSSKSKFIGNRCLNVGGGK
ncbi:hypothetical protein HA402_007196 [Bradysia odoriphaga]|nr:hypothetical protein HA402_007196 [Bradysia odoriphaga]